MPISNLRWAGDAWNIITAFLPSLLDSFLPSLTKAFRLCCHVLHYAWSDAECLARVIHTGRKHLIGAGPGCFPCRNWIKPYIATRWICDIDSVCHIFSTVCSVFARAIGTYGGRVAALALAAGDDEPPEILALEALGDSQGGDAGANEVDAAAVGETRARTRSWS